MRAVQEPPIVGDGTHLNLGCGNKLWEGFVNIDFPDNYSGKPPDIEADLREIPLPDEYADSAYAIHVLEHFYRWETEDVLKEWIRLIKPGGQLVIEVPCLDKVIWEFNEAIEEERPINFQATMWRLYGDPGYKDHNMVHKWCFSISELIHLFEKCGLKEVLVSVPAYHHPKVDIRISGKK